MPKIDLTSFQFIHYILGESNKCTFGLLLTTVQSAEFYIEFIQINLQTQAN